MLLPAQFFTRPDFWNRWLCGPTRRTQMTKLPRAPAPQDAAALFREQLARGEAVLGCFLSLGSPSTAELMANAGYDWALIDLEHGAGDERDALPQIQALAAGGSIAIVRVESTVRQRVHRVLDFGSHGIMFPRIDSADEAMAAVAAMRYPPAGVRGIASSNRAGRYGSNFRPYMAGSASLVTVRSEEHTSELQSL